jgi:hypothetical protein
MNSAGGTIEDFAATPLKQAAAGMVRKQRSLEDHAG